MLWTTLVCVLLTQSPVPAGPRTSGAKADEAAIKEVVSAFRAAIEQKNVSILEALFWPDGLVFEQGEPQRSGPAFVSERLGRRLKTTRFKWVDEVNSGRADVPLAYVAQEARVDLQSGTAPIAHTTQNFTFVLRKRGDAWKISHLHWSTAPAAP